MGWIADDYTRPEFWAEHCKWDSMQLSKAYGVSDRQWRKRISEAKKLYQYLPWRDDYRAGKLEIPDTGVSLPELRKLLKSKVMSVGQLSDHFEVPPKAIRTALDILKAEHFMVDCTDDMATLNTDLRIEDPLRIDFTKYKERTFGFGVVGDTHLGSKYERMDVLESLYDRFAAAGVDTVYHTGNWIDGEARFNKQDIYVHGLGGQVSNFVRKYPRREGIKTYIISGDDHEGWYVQREGINIGQYMENMARTPVEEGGGGRDDLIDLGYMERDIEFAMPSGSAAIRVMHGGGGSTYAHSYTSQKYVEMLQGGEKPKIALVGHFHKFHYAYPREVHVIQPGCFFGNTKIETAEGRVKIKDIQVGDLVLTHQGHYRPVTKLFSRDYSGGVVKVNYGRVGRPDQTVTCTDEHPFLVQTTSERDDWVEAKNLKVGDLVYVLSNKCRVCGDDIPYWLNLCNKCNPVDEEECRISIQTSKGGAKERSRISPEEDVHYYRDILPFCKEKEREGWSIVPIGGGVIPDAIGFREDEVVAFEVEGSKKTLLAFKQGKYTGHPISDAVDRVEWVDSKPRQLQPRAEYYPSTRPNFVLVPVVAIEKEDMSSRVRKTETVYNFEVAEDNSYVAGRVAVHNCTEDQTPFMRKRRIQAMVGGCLVWVTQNELGLFTSVKVEWFPYYNQEFYKYHW